jgi:xanthine/uracil permease
MTPAIVNLLTRGEGKGTLPNLIFAFAFVFSMFIAYRFMPALVRSTLIIWAMALASLAHLILFPSALETGVTLDTPLLGGFFSSMTVAPVLEPGVLISFLFCFLALSINDLGSIQSMDALLKPSNMTGRVKGGVTVTGLMNLVSGVLGVIGPVNFSLSPGVIASSGCASRFALIPTALLLLLLSCSPLAMRMISNVPSVIVAGVLLYILTSQVSAGLMVAFKRHQDFQFNDGLVIGLPLLVGTIAAFLPVEVLRTFPVALRPILGNGFVIGVVTVLVLEHLVFTDRVTSSHDGATNKGS